MSCPLIGQTPAYQNVIFVGPAPSGGLYQRVSRSDRVSTGFTVHLSIEYMGHNFGGPGWLRYRQRRFVRTDRLLRGKRNSGKRHTIST